ncbi:MAG: hypothetical protein J6386_24425 [Candidatus Synoicihabitans palmerolidicus]|nr:hypothetical protein [Candidatus Synoicihabitans palmerolidicus]
MMMRLQRTPVLRAVITTEFVVQSTVGSVLKGVLAGVAAMGAVQTVAGATARNPAEGSATNPTPAKVRWTPSVGQVGRIYSYGFWFF